MLVLAARCRSRSTSAYSRIAASRSSAPAQHLSRQCEAGARVQLLPRKEPRQLEHELLGAALGVGKVLARRQRTPPRLGCWHAAQCRVYDARAVHGRAAVAEEAPEVRALHLADEELQLDRDAGNAGVQLRESQLHRPQGCLEALRQGGGDASHGFADKKAATPRGERNHVSHAVSTRRSSSCLCACATSFVNSSRGGGASGDWRQRPRTPPTAAPRSSPRAPRRAGAPAPAPGKEWRWRPRPCRGVA